MLEEVEFLIFIDDFTAHAEGVQRLAPQGENGLGFRVARRSDGAGGGDAFRNEEGCFPGAGVLGVVMHPAVPEVLVVNFGLAGVFACQLLNAGEFLAVPFGILDFCFQGFGRFRVFVQVVVQLPGNEVAHKGADGFPFRADGVGAQLGFGLGFEDGFLHLDGDGGYEGGTDVPRLIIFLEEVPQGFDDGFPEGRLVGASLGGVLPVDEGVVLLPVLAAMSEGHFNVMPFQVDDGVQGVFAHRFRKQVQQPVFGDVAAAVEMQGQPFVEVGVVSAHFFDILRPELRGRGKDVRVRVESRAGAVGFLRGAVLPSLGDFLSAAELVGPRFPVAVGLDFKKVGQGVDRLDTHSVEAYGFFESVAVIFGSGVDFCGAVQQFAQRNAAAEVAHFAQAVRSHVNGDFFAEPHHEFVD